MTTPANTITEDPRWQSVAAAMRRHGHRPDALIETLHTVQEAFGYLPPVALRTIADALRVPLGRVYGVATFYHHFTLDPPACHVCVVCLGTACYIEGGPELQRAAERACGLHPGETAVDGPVSVRAVRCIGACSQGPLALLDGELLARAAPAELEARVREWMRRDA